MSFGLRLSPEAARSIEDQLRWYEASELNGGVELADRWTNLLSDDKR